MSPSLAPVFFIRPKLVTLHSESHRINGFLVVCEALQGNWCTMWPSVSVLPASWAIFPEINTLWSESHSQVSKHYWLFFAYRRTVLCHYRHAILQRTLQMMLCPRAFFMLYIISREGHMAIQMGNGSAFLRGCNMESVGQVYWLLTSHLFLIFQSLIAYFLRAHPQHTVYESFENLLNITDLLHFTFGVIQWKHQFKYFHTNASRSVIEEIDKKQCCGMEMLAGRFSFWTELW